MEKSLTTLTYSVRFPVIGKYIAQLLFLLSLLTLAPLIVALIFGDHAIALRYLSVIIFLLAISIPLSRISVPSHIQSNEALVIAALAFIISPLFMTYPIMASGLSFGDALFEAVSAVTTTGLTTVTDLQARPASFLFARAWMQWYGGLGIVVLSVALLMGHHLAARQLAEPLSSDTIATTARTHARRMLVIYVLMTLIGLLILWFITGSGFSALLHVLAAVSTGGFAPHDASLAAFDSLHVRYAVILMALCGAVPLPLYYLAWRKHIGEFFRNIELHGLLLITSITCTLLVLSMHFNSELNWQDSISQGILFGISAQTTSGFSSLDIVNLDDSSKLITVISMLIGGGVGSTAGGFKVLRLLILMRLIHLLILRTTLPSHAVVKPSLADKPLTSDEIQRAMLLILLFAMVVLASWLVFVSYGYPPLDTLFEVVSATGTVGLSTGITHTDLPALLKVVLCIDMLLGRVEIVALLIVLYPRTWFGKRAEPS
jgi:trk system potassium uptake protein TrkH